MLAGSVLPPLLAPAEACNRTNLEAWADNFSSFCTTCASMLEELQGWLIYGMGASSHAECRSVGVLLLP